jgi:hypothetical protein
MLMRDDTRNRWFLVMRPGDANKPGSAWFRVGAASRGKIVVRPIAPEGWLALVAFAAAWVMGSIGIWVGGFGSGEFSPGFAILATVLISGIVIAGFIRLVVGRMTHIPQPPDGQSR